MAQLSNLNDLFVHLLQDMYYAENQIKKTLPEMAEKASDPDLQEAFEKHLEETKEQISKLEEVFEIIGEEAEKEECQAIEGLLEEGDELIEEAEEGPVLDAALIAAAQKVEHYEIASYGALCAMARKLDQNEAAQILHEILEQEKDTDEKLSDLSDSIEEEAIAEAA
jgi:ferritin-like metal-binding protein YciE